MELVPSVRVRRQEEDPDFVMPSDVSSSKKEIWLAIPMSCIDRALCDVAIACLFVKLLYCSYVGWATWTMTKHIFSRQSVLVVCSCI